MNMRGRLQRMDNDLPHEHNFLCEHLFFSWLDINYNNTGASNSDVTAVGIFAFGK